MRTIHWGRVALGVIAAEAVPIVLLVIIVAVFGPREQTSAQQFATRLGQWVGPIGGDIMSFIAALWVARKSNQRRILHGTLVGVGSAVLDVGLIAISGAGFEWLFVVSNAGRVAAGWLGGLTADAFRRRT